MCVDKKEIELFNQRDPRFFRELVDRYQVSILNVCLAYTHNRDEASDLTQEVFIQAFRSASEFRGDSSIKTWLTRIAIHKSLNFLRKSKRITSTELNEANHSSFSSDSSDTQLLQSEQKKWFYRALDALPEKQREAFILHKLEENSYQEVAEIMGTSVSAVESLMHRAKVNLRALLEKVVDRG